MSFVGWATICQAGLHMTERTERPQKSLFCRTYDVFRCVLSQWRLQQRFTSAARATWSVGPADRISGYSIQIGFVKQNIDFSQECPSRCGSRLLKHRAFGMESFVRSLLGLWICQVPSGAVNLSGPFWDCEFVRSLLGLWICQVPSGAVNLSGPFWACECFQLPFCALWIFFEFDVKRISSGSK